MLNRQLGTMNVNIGGGVDATVTIRARLERLEAFRRIPDSAFISVGERKWLGMDPPQERLSDGAPESSMPADIVIEAQPESPQGAEQQPSPPGDDEGLTYDI